jgi:hypothetical protein
MLITEDYFEQHMKISTNKSFNQMNLYTKYDEWTSLMKRGSLIERSSLC